MSKIIELKVHNKGVVYFKKEILNALTLKPNDVIELHFDETGTVTLKKKLNINDIIDNHKKSNGFFHLSPELNTELDEELKKMSK